MFYIMPETGDSNYRSYGQYPVENYFGLNYTIIDFI
jgi:hypothetical protein